MINYIYPSKFEDMFPGDFFRGDATGRPSIHCCAGAASRGHPVEAPASGRVPFASVPGDLRLKPGWWLGHPSEKYESQLGWLATQYMGK